jgi:hypothetical protein
MPQPREAAALETLLVEVKAGLVPEQHLRARVESRRVLKKKRSPERGSASTSKATSA